jgi:uncharacterized protein YlxP (DUF503 family)
MLTVGVELVEADDEVFVAELLVVVVAFVELEGDLELLEVDEGFVEELLEEVVAFVELEEDLELLEADDEVLVEIPHVPALESQPAPQYADVLPHQPSSLQQFPKVEPRQVIVAEQVPSVEMV